MFDMHDPTRTHDPEDPRGRGFRRRFSVEFVRSAIDGNVFRIGSEQVRLGESHGRVLDETVIAKASVPHFARAAMDGFALIAKDTDGAGVSAPVRLHLIGQSRPGRPFPGQVLHGQAVGIATGAPMPVGADAVVPVEQAGIEGDALEVRTCVAPGRHVGAVAEDVAAGDEVLRPGRCLRPQDLGILSALGVDCVTVVRQPRVAILVTGDELLNAGSSPSEFAIPDMNSPMLSALIRRDGGTPAVFGPLADDVARLSREIRDRVDDPTIDAIFVNGGSSTGPEDHAPALIRELGTLLAHGVALRPAGPTGFGVITGKPVLLLPGNPVSCLCAYDLFGGVIVRKLGGRSAKMPYPVVRRRLAAPIVSASGRVDYVRVRLSIDDEAEPIATSGASILSTTTMACGFVIVPAEADRVETGTTVEVHLYDAH